MTAPFSRYLSRVFLGILLAAPWISPAAGATEFVEPGTSGKALPDEMQLQIKGQFKGRLLVNRIVAPVSMNLEKLQDFPEDRSQKILLEPLPLIESEEFNAREEVKGHAPFWPWIPAIPEPPFLRMTPPRGVPGVAWMYEVLNPEGKAVFRQRSTHELPDELLWEGKDAEKGFAVTDRLYAEQLTVFGADDKAMIIPGDSVILPALAINGENSQTVEVSLARLFNKGSADISPEGALIVSKTCESMRERALNKLHVRVVQTDAQLASMREQALVNMIKKLLHLADPQVEHDHSAGPSPRGDIAAFWLKPGGTP